MRDDLLEGAASAAAYTGISRRKIYRMANDGLLPHVRRGRTLFFRKSELDRAFRSKSAGRPRKVVISKSQWMDMLEKRSIQESERAW
jgi:excisionase family DNA binding protein